MLEAYEIGISLALQDGVSAGIALIRRDLDALDRAIAATSQNLSHLQAQAGTAAPIRASSPSPPKPLSQVAQTAPGFAPQSFPAATIASGQGVVPPASRSPIPDMVIRVEPIATPTVATDPTTPIAPVASRPTPVEVQAASRGPISTTSDAPQSPRKVTPSVGFPVALPVAPPPPQGAASQPERAPSSTPPMPAPARTAVAVPGRALPAAPPSPRGIPEPKALPNLLHAVTPQVTPPAPRVSGPSRLEGAVPPHSSASHQSGHHHHAPSRSASKAEAVSLRPAPAAPPAARMPTFAAPSFPSHQSQPSVPMRPVAPSILQSSPEPSRQSPPPGLTSSFAPPPSAPPNITLQGDIILDGARVGRWMTSTLARQAARPPAGPTGPDPRQTPLWSGQAQGF